MQFHVHGEDISSGPNRKIGPRTHHQCRAAPISSGKIRSNLFRRFHEIRHKMCRGDLQLSQLPDTASTIDCACGNRSYVQCRPRMCSQIDVSDLNVWPGPRKIVGGQQWMTVRNYRQPILSKLSAADTDDAVARRSPIANGGRPQMF